MWLLVLSNILCVLCSFASIVRLSVTLWTVAHQTLQSMGFSRQEYWSWLSCPPPGDPPNPGTEHLSFMSPALAGWIFTTSTSWEARNNVYWGSTTCQALPFFLNYIPKWKTGITDTQTQRHTHAQLAITETSHSCFQFRCHPLSLVRLFSHEGWHQL